MIIPTTINAKIAHTMVKTPKTVLVVILLSCVTDVELVTTVNIMENDAM